MSKIIIRVQSPEGTKRVELFRDSLSSLYEKILTEFNISKSDQNEWGIYLDRNRTKLIPNNRNSDAREFLSHGDMVFLLPNLSAQVLSQSVNERLEEDPVDIELSKMDGKISRNRDEQLCNHNPQAKCINCIPIEPFDLEYLNSRNPSVKYMSFHGYLRKLQSGGDRGKFTNLEILNCKIKPGCKEHPPWPKGICNKCQPSTVYLNRQPYRHVDNIMFANGQIVERFLNYWRRSGRQRIGLLYGRYEVYDGVPLGIRAVVSAIYEPPQSCQESRLELHLPDPNEEKVNRLAAKLGLKCVGWIFTDLVMDDTRKGTIKHFRGTSDSYFLSAEECITAAMLQNLHRNVTKYSSDGFFGSKFVTVVVTGDAQNQIHFEGYQVSNQCVSLVRDGCMIPTYDAPELAYIKESSNEQYIPDVYFREKDQYKNEVTKIGRPLPVEYLLIDLPAAFAKEPVFYFNENSSIIKTPFPIENRGDIAETQDFNSLQSYMKQLTIPNKFLEIMNDFHLLVFLVTNETVHFERAIDDLIEAIQSKNEAKALNWSRTPEWLTVEQIISEGASMIGNEWSCAMCTFHNEANATVCSICQTPRQ